MIVILGVQALARAALFGSREFTSDANVQCVPGLPGLLPVLGAFRRPVVGRCASSCASSRSNRRPRAGSLWAQQRQRRRSGRWLRRRPILPIERIPACELTLTASPPLVLPLHPLLLTGLQSVWRDRARQVRYSAHVAVGTGSWTRFYRLAELARARRRYVFVASCREGARTSAASAALASFCDRCLAAAAPLRRRQGVASSRLHGGGGGAAAEASLYGGEGDDGPARRMAGGP